jgi:hypothetical protein
MRFFCRGRWDKDYPRMVPAGPEAREARADSDLKDWRRGLAVRAAAHRRDSAEAAVVAGEEAVLAAARAGVALAKFIAGRAGRWEAVERTEDCSGKR